MLHDEIVKLSNVRVSSMLDVGVLKVFFAILHLSIYGNPECLVMLDFQSFMQSKKLPLHDMLIYYFIMLLQHFKSLVSIRNVKHQ